MAKAKTYTTFTGEVIVIENIDIVGTVSCNQLWDDGYLITMKSGNKIRVQRGRAFKELSECRNKLIALI